MSSTSGEEFLRIGTAERDEAGRLLGDHFAEGRLTTEEYEDRVAQALAAKTRADVRPLFTDLPAPHPSFLSSGAGPATDVEPLPTSPAGLTVASDRSATIAGILQLVLPFGAGRFYTGQTRLAVAQLLCTVFTFGVGALWPMIDGILLLVNGGTDDRGRALAR